MAEERGLRQIILEAAAGAELAAIGASGLIGAVPVAAVGTFFIYLITALGNRSRKKDRIDPELLAMNLAQVNADLVEMRAEIGLTKEQIKQISSVSEEWQKAVRGLGSQVELLLDLCRISSLRLDEHDRKFQVQDRINAESRETDAKFRQAHSKTVQVIEILSSRIGKLEGISRVLQTLAALAAPVQHNLTYASIGSLLKGRGEDLRKLRQGFAVKSAVAITQARAIHGSGGVGKTRLAIEFAWHSLRRPIPIYRAVFMLTADSPQNLQAGLAALAEPLGLCDRSQPDPEKTEAVLRWLQNPIYAPPPAPLENSDGQDRNYLLILDNADTEEAAQAVEELLPDLAGHVLITSRISNWSAAVRDEPLETISREAAVQFLLERTDKKRVADARQDPELAGKLAEDLLGCLPLALEQAAAYIAVKRMTLAEYIQAWELEREKVLGWCDKRLMQYPQSVLVTYERTIRELSPAARALLNLSAFLAPEPIPLLLLEEEGTEHLARAVGLLEDASSTLSTSSTKSLARAVELLEDPSGALARPPRPRDALSDLAKFSLAGRQAGTYTVHRLVQEVVRLRIPEGRRRAWTQATLEWVNACAPTEAGDVRMWKTWDPLRPHAEEVARRADAAGLTEPTAGLMNELGVYLLAKGLYEQSEPLMRRALDIVEKSFGPDHPNVASRLNNLAQLLGATNRLAEAEPLLRRALAIDEKSFGPDHPNVAIPLNNLALLLKATNRLAGAEPLLRRAVDIFEKAYGEDHPNVAAAINNLAALLQATNRLAEAEPLMRRALAIAEKSFGPDHPNVARNLNNLAVLLQDTNRLVEAEPLMRRALAIDEKSYGPDHPDVAIRLNNLAALLQATNRLAEAEPLFRRALAIDEQSFGPDHPEVAIPLNNLAALLQATNHLAEAEPLQRRALKIFQASYGPDHPDTQNAKKNLAIIIKEMGKK
jgi:tetratricopeptide (TPR) repeat protein